METDETDVALANLKRPMQSKKFVAFLIAEVTWKVIIFVITFMGMKNGTVGPMTGTLILTAILIAGFVEVGYILGQGSLDKYLGLAQIAAQNGHSIKLRGAEIIKHQPEKSPPRKDGDAAG